MKWKKREAEIAALRAKHGRDHSLARPFPDLSVQSTAHSLSDGFAKMVVWGKGVTVPGVTIAHHHKQGYEVMPKSEVKYAGKKP